MCCAMRLFAPTCRDFRGRCRILKGWNSGKDRLPSRPRWGIIHDRSSAMKQFIHIFLGIAVALLAGCGGPDTKNEDFFTSGNRDADQRAEQRVAKSQQIRGESSNADTHKKDKKSLYERLGGEKGIALIVDDFVPRALAD